MKNNNGKNETDKIESSYSNFRKKSNEIIKLYPDSIKHNTQKNINFKDLNNINLTKNKSQTMIKFPLIKKYINQNINYFHFLKQLKNKNNKFNSPTSHNNNLYYYKSFLQAKEKILKSSTHKNIELRNSNSFIKSKYK